MKHFWFILALLAGVISLLGLWLIPQPDTLLPAHSTTNFLTIASPTSSQTVVLGDVINVSAFLSGEGTPQKMELWVDGQLSLSDDVASMDGNPYSASSQLPWTPSTSGSHTLVARAVGDNWTTTSEAVTLSVVDFSAPIESAKYIPQPGDTLLKIAKKTAIDPVLLAAANPKLSDASALLTTADTVLIPNLALMSFEVTSPTLPIEPLPAANPSTPSANRIMVWLHSLLGETSKPTAPVITAQVNGCQTRIMVQDFAQNEEGFILYRLAPNASGFERVNLFGANTSSDIFEILTQGGVGVQQFALSAVNTAAEAQSNFVQVSISQQDSSLVDQNRIVLSNIKIESSLPVDRLYCYASNQAGSWQRLPQDPRAFAYPADGIYALGQDIEREVDNNSLIGLECWGLQGDALVPLGAGAAVVEEDHPVLVVGESFTASADARLKATRPGGLFPLGGKPTPTVTKRPKVNLDPNTLQKTFRFAGIHLNAHKPAHGL